MNEKYTELIQTENLVLFLCVRKSGGEMCDREKKKTGETNSIQSFLKMRGGTAMHLHTDE